MHCVTTSGQYLCRFLSLFERISFCRGASRELIELQWRSPYCKSNFTECSAWVYTRKNSIAGIYYVRSKVWSSSPAYRSSLLDMATGIVNCLQLTLGKHGDCSLNLLGWEPCTADRQIILTMIVMNTRKASHLHMNVELSNFFSRYLHKTRIKIIWDMNLKLFIEHHFK